MESPNCQKTLCPQDYSFQKPPGCAAFYDILPRMSTVVPILQQLEAIIANVEVSRKVSQS